jgi:predicted nuclease with TOPRIM domain
MTNMDNMEKVAAILEQNQAIIQELIDRIEFLEDSLGDAQEELRSLRTDHSLLEDDVRGIERELRSLASEVEFHTG